MVRGAIAVRGIAVTLPPQLPIAQLLIGKPVDHAIDLVPRIFNLCRAAQSLAVRMACGLGYDDRDVAVLHREIVQEHRLRLGVLLPAKLGLPRAELPVIGPDMALDHALAAAPVLAALNARFAPFDAAVKHDPMENSVAARQAHHPIMQEAAARFGRGPLWRVLARFCEISAGGLPGPKRDGGWVSVPAARGTYRMRAAVIDGRITDFERRTPTDDMLQSGGVLEQSFGALKRPEDASLLVEVLDPCVPLEIRQVQDA